jgi:hypothetical protein
MIQRRLLPLRRPVWRGLLSLILMLPLVALLNGAQPTRAETFNSGSTGADGDLILTTPGTIIFDPRTFNPPLDPDGDNIYHFGTITIGAGVTVRLSATYIDGPVVWLATGAVTINGTIDLKGEDGQNQTTIPSNGGRFPSVPGAGGYPGGVGNYSDTPGSPAQPGAGPGGGNNASPGNINGGCAAHASSACGKAAYGNAYLVPLVGGSGGGGGLATGPNYVGAAGGAGGGAMLMASSTSIVLAGQILANGGVGGTGSGGGNGGYGSGGAIRLVAPTISGAGSVNVNGGISGNSGIPSGSPGRVRIEAYQYSFTGSVIPGSNVFGRGTPSGLFLDQARQPAVRIASVASANVPTVPSGSFGTPDVTINSNSAVNVTLQARGIPPGTTVKLIVIPEVGVDQTLDSLPLAGTLEQSTVTMSVTLPPGYTRMYVYSNWTP